MLNEVTDPVVESVANVPLAVPPSSKVTPSSVQTIVEAKEGSGSANRSNPTASVMDLIFIGESPAIKESYASQITGIASTTVMTQFGQYFDDIRHV